MKKIRSAFNICFTVFLFLFALEPILGSYAPYWYAMYALIAVGIVVLLTTVTNGFRKKIFPLKQVHKDRCHIVYSTIYICLRHIRQS